MMREALKRSWIIWAVIVSPFKSFPTLAAEPVRSVDLVEASAFLEGYRAASESPGAQFYDLYSDRAVIHARTWDHSQGIVFQGRTFKAWGRQLLEDGRAAPDGSIFRDATVEQRGIRLLIRAKRYSTTRCYWDPNYQVGIEREGSSYRIVDERLTTNPAAQCVRHPLRVGPVSMAPSREFIPLRTSEGLRALDSKNTPSWHPLSQQELADKAMQLAQQMATLRASLAPTNGPGFPSLNSAASPVGVSSVNVASVASRVRGDASSDLRVTPQE